MSETERAEFEALKRRNLVDEILAKPASPPAASKAFVARQFDTLLRAVVAKMAPRTEVDELRDRVASLEATAALKSEVAALRVELEAIRKSMAPPALRSVA